MDTPPDVLRDCDASDHTITRPDLLEEEDSVELKDTPAFGEGKYKYFHRRRVLPRLWDRVVKEDLLMPCSPVSPPEIPKLDNDDDSWSSEETVIHLRKNFNLQLNSSTFVLEDNGSIEPRRLISTPKNMRKALADYNVGPNVSIIESSFISGHNEVTQSSCAEETTSYIVEFSSELENNVIQDSIPHISARREASPEVPFRPAKKVDRKKNRDEGSDILWQDIPH